MPASLATASASPSLTFVPASTSLFRTSYITFTTPDGTTMPNFSSTTPAAVYSAESATLTPAETSSPDCTHEECLPSQKPGGSQMRAIIIGALIGVPLGLIILFVLFVVIYDHRRGIAARINLRIQRKNRQEHIDQSSNNNEPHHRDVALTNFHHQQTPRRQSDAQESSQQMSPFVEPRLPRPASSIYSVRPAAFPARCRPPSTQSRVMNLQDYEEMDNTSPNWQNPFGDAHHSAKPTRSHFRSSFNRDTPITLYDHEENQLDRSRCVIKSMPHTRLDADGDTFVGHWDRSRR